MKFPVHLDPGHGGDDTGAVAGGHIERDLTRAQASYLAQLLRTRGYAVTVGPQQTESGQKFPNSRRTALANRANAVLLCLHFNAGGGRYGLVKYRSDNPQSSRLAGFLRARLAACIGQAVSEVQVKLFAPGDRGSGLLAGAKRSAVLLEPLFLDNPAHAEWLHIRANRVRLCEAIADALDDLARSVSH